MRLLQFFAFCITALAGAAPLLAQTTPDRPMAMAPAVIGSTWTAIEIDGVAPPTDQSTFLIGEDNVTASGNGGCNHWSAPVTIDGESLAVGTIVATQKACLGPGMKQERDFFAALGRTRGFETAEGQLRFLDAGGTVIVRFAV